MIDKIRIERFVEKVEYYITILNNKAGCFDAHDLDKSASIYI